MKVTPQDVEHFVETPEFCCGADGRQDGERVGGHRGSHGQKTCGQRKLKFNNYQCYPEENQFFLLESFINETLD